MSIIEITKPHFRVIIFTRKKKALFGSRQLNHPKWSIFMMFNQRSVARTNINNTLTAIMNEKEAVIYPLDNNEVLVRFESPQRAPAKGQAAVFYLGDVVLGGGTIR